MRSEWSQLKANNGRFIHLIVGGLWLDVEVQRRRWTGEVVRSQLHRSLSSFLTRMSVCSDHHDLIYLDDDDDDDVPLCEP